MRSTTASKLVAPLHLLAVLASSCAPFGCNALLGNEEATGVDENYDEEDAGDGGSSEAGGRPPRPDPRADR